MKELQFRFTARAAAERWVSTLGWIVCSMLLPPAVLAQAADTTRVYEIDPVVVTAERTRAPLVTSTAAVSVISGQELRRLPLLSVADALQTVPGLAFLDFDGLGLDPKLTVRGFYGGGEAEYVVVLWNGRPLNGLETGLVNWDMIPLAAVQGIEVVRGGASSLYGDAALGGVINLITEPGADRALRWSLSGGELGLLRASAAVDDRVGSRSFSLFGDLRRAEGFREHAERSYGSVGGSLALLEGPGGSLTLSTLHHRREFDEPGPLADAIVSESRERSAPFFRFDHTAERLHRLALDGRTALAASASLSGYLAGERRTSDAVRTLPLSTEFADTKNRVLGTTRLFGSTQLQLDHGVGAGEGTLLVGLDGSLGWLDSEYYAVLTGPATLYQQAAGTRGELDARGSGSRGAAAAFLRYELRPTSAVRLSLGGRLDWLRDSFAPEAPSEGEELKATHTAFSPKAGINLRYLRSARQEGHLFANVGRSFKAPTPDQLFDQRSVPVPFPPFSISYSNELLQPQTGTSVESGLYHRAELLPGTLAGELHLAAYQLDMRDELDFDLESFRYVNLGRSRHRGVEAGVKLLGPAATTAFLNYTLQSVTSRSGESAGKQLKAIPRHFFSGGISAAHTLGLAGSLTATAARGIYLDDANTLELPGFTRWDARLSYPLRGVRLSLDVFNLLDREYSTTGFPDPAGSGVVYYYPAAGRVLQVGLSRGW